LVRLASRALDCPKLSPIYWAKTGATFTAKLPIYVWQSIFKKSAVVVENEQSVIEDVQTMNNEQSVIEDVQTMNNEQSVIENVQTMNKESLFDVSSNTFYKGVQQVNSYPFPPSYVIPLFTFKMPF
jgi:predicted solute-binding protein